MSAVSGIIDRFSGFITRVSHSFRPASPVIDSHDLSQCASLALLSLGRQDGIENFEAYAKTIIKNAIQDEVGRFTASSGPCLEQVTEDRIDVSTILDYVIQASVLSDIEEKIFCRRILGSQSAQQLANELKLSVSTIYRVERRIFEKVRGVISERQL